jgi:chorismate-pyruvate lyase
MHPRCNWQNDDGDVRSGTMTFRFAAQDVAVHFETFKEAFDLHNAILEEIRNVRYDARAGLIREIGRIEP